MSETNAVVEKSLRSVFVGNIPYEATEEKLRDIFSQVGPVISFKLMYDRESGKPKGYGFCEYKDQETALSAMRNLNGYEIGGRALRVDNACTEKSRMEMQSLMMGPIIESPYGPDVDPDKAPEAISNAVASLPPEQMYELMRQMKVCVRDNPTEARNMLMNNPQLAYALLQAQVVMRIIEPKMAVQILHGEREHCEPILPSSAPPPMPHPNMQGPPPMSGPPNMMNGGPHMNQPPHMNQAPPPMPQGPHSIPSNMPNRFPPPQNVSPMPPQGGPGPGGFSQPPMPVPPPTRGPMMAGDFDHRQISLPPRGPLPQSGPPVTSVPLPGPPGGDQDMRMPPSVPAPTKPKIEPYLPPASEEFVDRRFNRDQQRGDFDQRESRFREGPLVPRDLPPPVNRDMPPANREMRETFMRDPRERDRDNRGARDPRDSRGDPRDPRGGERDRDRDYRATAPSQPSADTRDPRGRHFTAPGGDKDFRSVPGGPAPPPSVTPVPVPRPAPPSNTQATLPPGLAGQDQEKASLIMQVLQLSDEQIRMLPPEQQASILQLKEQIQRSQQ